MTDTVLVVALPAFALQVYVVAPDPVSTALAPEQIVEPPATETVGVATIVIVLVLTVLVPNEFVAVCVTVCVPAAVNVTTGFCKVEVAGEPPEKVQLHDVGELVDASVKVIF